MSAESTTDFYKTAFDDPYNAYFLKEQFLLTSEHEPSAQVPIKAHGFLEVISLEYIEKMVRSLGRAAEGIGSSIPSGLANDNAARSVLSGDDVAQAEWADDARKILYYMYEVKKIGQFGEGIEPNKYNGKAVQTIESSEYSLEQIEAAARNLNTLPYNNMIGLITAIGAARVKEHLFEWDPEEWVAIIHKILSLEKGLEFLTGTVLCRVYFDQIFSWDFLDATKCEDFPMFEHTGVWSRMAKPYFELAGRLESLRTDTSNGIVPGTPKALQWLVEWNEDEPVLKEIKDEGFMRQR